MTSSLRSYLPQEIEDAFSEEHEAYMTFALISQKETQLQIKKANARQRLLRAREEKAALMRELMSL